MHYAAVAPIRYCTVRWHPIPAGARHRTPPHHSLTTHTIDRQTDNLIGQSHIHSTQDAGTLTALLVIATGDRKHQGKHITVTYRNEVS